MQSITLWIQFIIFLHAGRCSWPDKWNLQQSPQLSVSVSVSKASGPWHLQSSQKGKKRCQVLHFPSWKKFGFGLTFFFFLNLLFGYKLRSLTLVALQAYGWILPRLVWSIFASFRYRFDTCPEPTCAAQSHHYSIFFWRFWNLSNSVSQTNLGSKKSAKSTW